jgi:hypothetical protein
MHERHPRARHPVRQLGIPGSVRERVLGRELVREDVGNLLEVARPAFKRCILRRLVEAICVYVVRLCDCLSEEAALEVEWVLGNKDKAQAR